MTKKLTEMWKALTDVEKKVYENKALVEKERYHGEMEAKGMAVKKKVVVDEDAPKKAQSSFFLFSHEARERIKKAQPEIKQTEILKKVGAEWKALTDNEKKKWEDKSKADKERYERELAVYKGSE